MEETGRIIEIKGGLAKVEVARKKACGKCPAESFCSMGSDGLRSIEVLNEAGAKMGDTVKIVVDPVHVLKSAFLVYIFPLLFMFGAGGVAYLVARNNIAAIIAGSFGFVASIGFIWSLDKKIGRSRKPVSIVKEIIKEQASDDCKNT